MQEVGALLKFPLIYDSDSMFYKHLILYPPVVGWVLKSCKLTGVYLIIRRTPFRAGPPDRVDTAKSSKKEEDDDNWELPQGGLPG